MAAAAGVDGGGGGAEWEGVSLRWGPTGLYGDDEVSPPSQWGATDWLTLLKVLKMATVIGNSHWH